MTIIILQYKKASNVGTEKKCRLIIYCKVPWDNKNFGLKNKPSISGRLIEDSCNYILFPHVSNVNWSPTIKSWFGDQHLSKGKVVLYFWTDEWKSFAQNSKPSSPPHPILSLYQIWFWFLDSSTVSSVLVF